MRFDFVRVMTCGPLPSDGVPLVHWQAWPLDGEAARVGLWSLGPASLCRRNGLVLAYEDATQCEECAIRACLVSNAAKVFDRLAARQIAGRYEGSTA